MFACGVSRCTDRGVERLINHLADIRPHELFPYFKGMEFQIDGETDEDDGMHADDDDFNSFLNFKSCLDIDGAYHLTNHIAKGMLFAMPNYSKLIHPLLDAMVKCVNAKYLRGRFINMCLSVGEGIQYLHMFDKGMATLIKW